MSDSRPTIVRFEEKVLKEPGPGGCWLWRASLDRKGYGRFRYEGRIWGAHRFAYMYYVGPVPERLELDHLCRVRDCCNPLHLEPVTGSVNSRRGIRSTNKMCPSGHLVEGDNHRLDPKGHRRCVACCRASDRERRLLRLAVRGSDAAAPGEKT